MRKIFLIALVTFCASTAHAYEIGTGFSDACHERMTVDASEGVVSEFVEAYDVPLPESDRWEQATDEIFARLDLTGLDRVEKFVVVSLLIGARWPDTEGHAPTNIGEVRPNHATSEEQYDHALRAISDDGPEGNELAVNGTNLRIREEFENARGALELSPEEQLLTREVFVEFYGPTDIKVWRPAFHLGFAAHIVQDSFSHTIRSDDLKRIYHVLNYIEASRGELVESRDGLPHSKAMDGCRDDAAPIIPAASEATLDLFTSFRLQALGGKPGELDLFLMEWMSLEQECGLDADFCGSRWVDIARRQPTRPLLSGCSTGGSPSLLAIVLGFLGFMRRR